MSRKILFRDKAISEMMSAYWWYEDAKIGLGDVFLKKIDTYIDIIKENPEAFRIVYKKFRQIPIKKFPFVILYKVYPSAVVIHSVFHTSQNPDKKFKRKK